MSLVKPVATPTPKSPNLHFSEGLPFQSVGVCIDATHGLSNAPISTILNPWAHQGTITWTISGAKFAEENGIAFNTPAPFELTRISDTEYQATYINDTLSQTGPFAYTITTADEMRDDPTVENDPPGEPLSRRVRERISRTGLRTTRRRRSS